mgnify:CR=1 FL=1
MNRFRKYFEKTLLNLISNILIFLIFVNINIVLKGENSIILNNDNVYDDECYLLGIYALKENDDNKHSQHTEKVYG